MQLHRVEQDRVRTAAAAAAPAQLDAAERRLGFELPRLLKKLYVEVANRDFGPGFGFFPAPPADTSGPWRGNPSLKDLRRDWNMLDHYWELCSSFVTVKFEPAWPRFFVPLCEWGCGIYSAVDCSTREGKIIAFETDQDQKGGLTPEELENGENFDRPPIPEPPGSRASKRFDFYVVRPSVEDWIEAWVEGVDLFHETEVINESRPQKRKPQKRV